MLFLFLFLVSLNLLGVDEDELSMACCVVVWAADDDDSICEMNDDGDDDDDDSVWLLFRSLVVFGVWNRGRSSDLSTLLSKLSRASLRFSGVSKLYL